MCDNYVKKSIIIKFYKIKEKTYLLGPITIVR